MSHLTTQKKKRSPMKGDSHLSEPHQEGEGHTSRSPVSGSSSSAFTDQLCTQVLAASAPVGEESAEERALLVEKTLAGIRPQDEIEGMLAAQMMAVHNVTMHTFAASRSASATFLIKAARENHGIKLARTFAALAQTLSVYRASKSTAQSLTVSSVNVHEGGQAIVGNVNQKS